MVDEAFRKLTDKLAQREEELQIHQTQLEMQNEELRTIQSELENERLKYFELYDLAPVAYFTVDNNGKIKEANLTAAAMLGLTKRDLIGKSFSQFIISEDADKLHLHCKSVLNIGESGGLIVRMKPKGKLLWGMLKTKRLTEDESFHVILSDVTGKMEREAELTMIGRVLRHEINNILQVVLAGVELSLHNVDQNTETHNYLNMIQNAAKEGAKITANLLADFGSLNKKEDR